MLFPLLLLGGFFLLRAGNRATIANNNFTAGISAFRIHSITFFQVEMYVKLGITNSSNQDYKAGKAFFVLKYPKGTLTNSFQNELATAESLMIEPIPARSKTEREFKMLVPTNKLLAVVKEYFTSTKPMIAQVTGTIALDGTGNGLNLPPMEIDLRKAFDSVKSQVKGILGGLL